MKTLSLFRYAPLLLLGSMMLFSWTACDENADESCDFSRDAVGEWYYGYGFRALFESEDDEFSEYDGFVEEIYLGVENMLELDDVCTGEPVVVSAEVVAKAGNLQNIHKAYLYFVNPVTDGLKLGRFVTLARVSTDEGDNKLQVNKLEIPAFPDFHAEGYAGKVNLGILVFTYGLYCDEDEKDQTADYYLSQVVQSAKITVSYTQY